MKLSCKIVDKRKKDGWFSMSYFVTFQVIDSRVKDSPSQEIEVPISQYYNLVVGATYQITFYKHSDGLYYTSAE